jgi:hypothetical protein
MLYQYKALPNPEAEIRVAVLQPGAYHDEIRVAFFSRPFGPGTISKVL